MKSIPRKSISDEMPHLLAEWSPLNNTLDPYKITCGSDKKATWICSSGHEWVASISSRAKINGTGCPVCDGKRVVSGFNDLLTSKPELCLEWDQNRNALGPHKYAPFSNKKVWWICSSSHSWEATIASRSHQANGCPYCAGQRAIQGFNDLGTTHPELVKEWFDTTITPDTAMAASIKNIKWKCIEGHIWEAQISNRALRGDGCRECSGAGSSKIEQTLREVLNGFAPMGDRKLDIPWRNNKSMEVDARMLDDQNTIVEYDGVAYHSQEITIERDLAKTAALIDSGHRVIRVRQYPLDYLELDIPGLYQELFIWNGYEQVQRTRLAELLQPYFVS